MLSIIIPCFNEENSVNAIYNRLSKVMEKLGEEWEIIFVDDGSADGTLNRIMSLTEADAHIAYISLSRNFGKESAMYAGLCNAKGDLVAVMDADLQDPPEMLPEMLEAIRSNDYDCAAARRATRTGEPKVRSAFARLFYAVVNRITDAEIIDGARDFRVMKREMVDAIISMNEYNRFSKGIFGWVGFRTKWFSFENVARNQGKSKWSFWSLTKYAIGGIVNFSQTPLTIVSGLGLILTLFAFLALFIIIIRRLLFGDPVMGWASTVSVIVFMSGVQMFSIGVLGQYVGKTYMETKNRPHYIIRKTNIDSAKKVN